LRLVGTSNDTNLHIGKWQEAELAGTEIRFLPLFRLQKITLEAYCLQLNTLRLWRCLASDFMHFHRIEPTLATLRWPGRRPFIHNDIQKQMQSRQNAILWQHSRQGILL